MISHFLRNLFWISYKFSSLIKSSLSYHNKTKMNWLWLLKSLESKISLGFWTKVLTRKRCLVNPSVVSWQNTVPMLKVKWVFIWQCLALTYRLDGQVCIKFVLVFCPFFIYKMVNTMEFLPITKGVTGRSKSWCFRPFYR